ncbi:unnamed protein product [Musa hybrid cultivar]
MELTYIIQVFIHLIWSPLLQVVGFIATGCLASFLSSRFEIMGAGSTELYTGQSVRTDVTRNLSCQQAINCMCRFFCRPVPLLIFKQTIVLCFG